MTTTDTNLNQLIINELTQAEYDTITPNANELYITTDGVIQSTDVINALGYTPVNKAGDTMTGGLVMNVSTDKPIIIENVSTTQRDIEFKTANHRVGVIRAAIDANDSICSFIFGACNPNNDFPEGFRLDRTNSKISCSFPNTDCVDGQWVNSNTAIISSATSLNGSTALTYRMVLPNDGHLYEVILRGQVTTGASTGNYVFLSCAGNEISSVTNICGAQTRAASSVQSVGSGIVIASYVASGSTNLSVTRNTNFNGNVNTLTMIAYRRIGSNT